VYLLVPLLAATAVLSGRTQTSPKPAPQTAGQMPVFTATTDFVRTDVIVRDSKGRFVPGLTAADFVVYEDDVRQTIGSFRPFIGGRDMGPALSAPSRSRGGLIVPPRAPADTSGRIFIVFIDDLSFQANATSQVRRIMGLLEHVIQEEDRIGIVSSGYSSIAVDLVHDYGYKHLEEAIGRTMGSGMSSRDIITAASTSQGPAGLRYMTHTALRTANEIIDKLSLVSDARKSFIYISEGYDFDPYKDSRLKHEQELYGVPAGSNAQSGSGSDSTASQSGSPFQKPGQQFAESDLVSDLAELIRNANRANVTFYPIDPRGLVAGPGIDETVSMAEHRDHIVTSIDSLKAIAENTGGFCTCDTNDVQGGLDRINNETSDYYMLGYNSSNADPKKLRRQIRIELRTPGLTAIYRTEYTFTLRRPGL
jgi:VWFA-related protein